MDAVARGAAPAVAAGGLKHLSLAGVFVRQQSRAEHVGPAHFTLSAFGRTAHRAAHAAYVPAASFVEPHVGVAWHSSPVPSWCVPCGQAAQRVWVWPHALPMPNASLMPVFTGQSLMQGVPHTPPDVGPTYPTAHARQLPDVCTCVRSRRTPGMSRVQGDQWLERDGNSSSETATRPL